MGSSSEIEELKRKLEVEQALNKILLERVKVLEARKPAYSNATPTITIHYPFEGGSRTFQITETR